MFRWDKLYLEDTKQVEEDDADKEQNDSSFLLEQQLHHLSPHSKKAQSEKERERARERSVPLTILGASGCNIYRKADAVACFSHFSAIEKVSSARPNLRQGS